MFLSCASCSSHAAESGRAWRCLLCPGFSQGACGSIRRGEQRARVDLFPGPDLHREIQPPEKEPPASPAARRPLGVLGTGLASRREAFPPSRRGRGALVRTGLFDHTLWKNAVTGETRRRPAPRLCTRQEQVQRGSWPWSVAQPSLFSAAFVALCFTRS